MAGPINENGSNKPQGVEKQRTWTRLARMDYGPMETLKESITPVLGKRLHHAQQQVCFHNMNEQAGKRVKIGDVTQTTEAAGVSEHPCRTQ